jgi:hypothetical protein
MKCMVLISTCLSLVLLTGISSGAPTFGVFRDLPDKVDPGEEFSVDFTVIIAEGQGFYEMEEDFPTDFAISNSGDFSWPTSTFPNRLSKLVLGVSPGTYTLTYSLIAPETSGLYEWPDTDTWPPISPMYGAPKYQIDGMDSFAPIGGDTQLSVGVIPAPGAFVLAGLGIGCVAWLRKRRAI